MTDGEDNSITGAGDLAKILGKSKYWPVVANRAEIGVERIGKDTVVYELSANNDVATCLIGD